MTAQEQTTQSQVSNPKHRRMQLLILVVILAIIAIIIYNLISNRPKDYISVSGIIEATDVVLSSKVLARVEAVNAQEGDAVKKGEVLVRLRQAEFVDQIRQAQAAQAAAQARLNEALAGARIEDIDRARAQVSQAESTVAGAREALALAQQGFRDSRELQAQLQAAQTNVNTATAAYQQAMETLRLVRQGPRIEDIQQAQAVLRQAEANSARAQEDYQRAQILYQRGAVPASQLDADRASAQTAQAQVEQAKAALSALQAGSRPEEIRRAQAAAAQAQAALIGAQKSLNIARAQYQERLPQRNQLTTAQTQYQTSQDQLRAARATLQELLAGTRPEEIDQLRRQVQQAAAALSQARTQLQYTTVVSPIAGRVITRDVEPGELATVGSSLMEIANLDEVWLRVYVEEPDYGRIKLGQSAAVTVDSYPNEVFTGKITEIAQQAEFTPKEIQTREQRAKLVFGVKITLRNTQLKLKPGMPADAVLHLQPLPAK